MRETYQECEADIEESTGELMVVLCQLTSSFLGWCPGDLEESWWSVGEVLECWSVGVVVECWSVGVLVVVFMVVLLVHPRWCRAWPAWLRPDHSRTVTSQHSVLSEGSDNMTALHHQPPED